jgi:RNA polymerase sigma factor for flagellar operon FliA
MRLEEPHKLALEENEADGVRRDRLLLENLVEVQFIARRIHRRVPSHVSFDDLFHAGILGLINAIDKFDAQKNVQLKSYARFRIRGAIMDSLRKLDWGSRNLRRQARRVDRVTRELSNELGASPSVAQIATKLCIELEDLHRLLGEIRGLRIECLETGPEESIGKNDVPLAFRAEEDPFQMTLREEIRAVLEVALSELDEKEAQVLCWYYNEELTMKKIGLILGIGESRVSQIHASALVSLRPRLNLIR